MMILMILIFPGYGSTNTVGNLMGGTTLGTFVCLGIAALTKCPRCGAGMRDMTYKAALAFTYEMPDCCPRCGVSLDAPMRSPADKP